MKTKSGSELAWELTEELSHIVGRSSERPTYNKRVNEPFSSTTGLLLDTQTMAYSILVTCDWKLDIITCYWTLGSGDWCIDSIT